MFCFSYPLSPFSFFPLSLYPFSFLPLLLFFFFLFFPSLSLAPCHKSLFLFLLFLLPLFRSIFSLFSFFFFSFLFSFLPALFNKSFPVLLLHLSHFLFSSSFFLFFFPFFFFFLRHPLFSAATIPCLSSS